MIATVFQIALWLLPWSLRRLILNRVFRYGIDRAARIGFSIILADELELGPGARIGSLTMVKGVRLLKLGREAQVGNLNWITGASKDSAFFRDQPERDPSLTLGDHASITHRHLVDCSDAVEIGAFTTIGGWNSQILTHSIEVSSSRQRANPVRVGAYCFVGTNVVLLKGSVLPAYSVLSAGSVLASNEEATHGLYAGNPARRVKDLDPELAYFTRKSGFVG